MAHILLIETSTTLCSVGLAENGVCTYLKELNEGYSHAENLTLFIQSVLNESTYKWADIDAVCVGKGPGSYTGLRIGVSVAKGICFASGLPLISLNSLEIMASGAIQSYPGYEAYLSLTDARRMEVYAALYNHKLEELISTRALIMNEYNFEEKNLYKKILCFGDGAEKCRSLLPENYFIAGNIWPSAKYMAVLAEKKFEMKDFETASEFEPFYLKDFITGNKNFN